MALNKYRNKKQNVQKKDLKKLKNIYDLLLILLLATQVSLFWYYVHINYPMVNLRNNYYFPILIAAIVSTTSATLMVTNKSKKNSLMQILLYTTLLIMFISLISSENIKYCTIIYELFMLASIFLFYYSSVSDKSNKILKDFIIWTQFGSLLVFVGGMGYVYDIGLIQFFDNKMTSNSCNKLNLYTWIILIGIFIKIPVIPFHYWITKVHVEASTSFSMFLSGFLVKVAIVFFYKIIPFMSPKQELITLWVVVLSTVISVFMLFGESDLKRFIAICTIHEMGFGLVILLMSKSSTSSVSGNLMLIHSLISIILFWISDKIYLKLGHRSLSGTGGLWFIAPRTTILLFIIFFLLKGIPLTFRYNVEIQTLDLLILFNFKLGLLLIIITAFLLNIIIVYRLFKLLYGTPNKDLLPSEISFTEIIPIILPLILLIYSPFV